MRSSSLFSLGLLVLGILSTWAQEEKQDEKSGVCPRKMPGKCPGEMHSECTTDFHKCKGLKKCCPTICGKKCVYPVRIQKPVWRKPGRCSAPVIECYIPNPFNQCEFDGDCASNLKCCKGSCGKVCKPPV